MGTIHDAFISQIGCCAALAHDNCTERPYRIERTLRTTYAGIVNICRGSTARVSFPCSGYYAFKKSCLSLQSRETLACNVRGIRTCTVKHDEFASSFLSDQGRRQLLLKSREHRGRPRLLCLQARSSGQRPAGGETETSIQLYGKIERVFSESARRTQAGAGGSGRWEEVEGSWVLRPSQGQPTAVVHFIGGAFVGASPHLTYRLFLERLVERGVVVVATPFATSFDHARVADEAQFKFDRCMRALRDPQLDALPVFGMGHSLGALTHVLIGSKYAVQRAGNVLISFNNKEVGAALPLLSPAILPFAQRLGPLLQQLTTSPALKMGASMAFQQVRGLNPALVGDLLPLLEQLPPLYQDLADGKDQFVPSPEETVHLVRGYYGVRRNLLVRFEKDSIDESPELAETLRLAVNVGPMGEVALRVLSGDHARPLQQVLPELPQGMADAISQGGAFVASLAGASPLADLAKGFGQSLGSTLDAQRVRQAAAEDIEGLVDEVSEWMGTAQRAGQSEASRWLPTR